MRSAKGISDEEMEGKDLLRRKTWRSGTYVLQSYQVLSVIWDVVPEH